MPEKNYSDVHVEIDQNYSDVHEWRIGDQNHFLEFNVYKNVDATVYNIFPVSTLKIRMKYLFFRYLTLFLSKYQMTYP